MATPAPSVLPQPLHLLRPVPRVAGVMAKISTLAPQGHSIRTTVLPLKWPVSPVLQVGDLFVSLVVGGICQSRHEQVRWIS